ncbi:hypothetical protein [Sphingobium xenophagum]
MAEFAARWTGLASRFRVQRIDVFGEPQSCQFIPDPNGRGRDFFQPPDVE